MAKPFQSPTNHTPRTCATLLMSAGHSPPPWARLVPYGHAPRIENPCTGPRTCATLLMSAGHKPAAMDATCPARPRTAKYARLFQSPTNHTPRTCATLLMSAGHSPPPWARLVPYGHAPRIENPGTGPRTCAILSMSTSHKPAAPGATCPVRPRTAECKKGGDCSPPSLLEKGDL